MSVHSHISENACQTFTNFFLYVAYGHGSVILWWRCDIPDRLLVTTRHSGRSLFRHCNDLALLWRRLVIEAILGG